MNLPGPDPRLIEFIHLFNQKYFFEAHEVLEGLWLETEGKAKNFYKGLIQCAVAFVHLQRGNLRGAKKLFRTSTGYLCHYLPKYGHINTAQLMKQFEDFFATCVQDAEERKVDPDIGSAVTPSIRLTPPR